MSFSLSVRFLALINIVSLGAMADGVTPKPIVIEVCDAVLADKLLDVRPAMDILRLGAGDEVEAFSPVEGQQWVAPMQSIGHPFLAAAHWAFADHRPLALSPDMIWQLLVQMAAEEVHAAPEKYRGLFSEHAHGHRTLEVRRDHFILGRNDNNWPGVFAELERRVVSKAPDSPARDFAHVFSTSSATEIAARQVVLLKAASPFYNYQMSTWCGIPRIELHGTVDDWRWIRTRLHGLQQFNMERRVKAMMPVLDECVAAAEGKATPAFWKSYYKYDSESGSSYVSGWINVFFVGEDDKMLDRVLDPNFSWITPPEQKTNGGALNLPLALTTDSYVSNGVIDVDFIWQYLEQTIPMRWRVGFMGVAQDRESKTLRPVIAWQVLRAKLHSEERKAADHLSGVKSLDFFTLHGIERGLALAPETGRIRVVPPHSGGPIDSSFWVKALPVMTQLESIQMGALLDIVGIDDDERKAICETMLGAPSVREVIIPKYFNEEFLRILQERKDWKITVK